MLTQFPKAQAILPQNPRKPARKTESLLGPPSYLEREGTYKMQGLYANKFKLIH